MIGFVALDLVLRIVRARVMDIAFVVHVPCVHAHDAAADPPSFGIPAHVIAGFEYFCHPLTRLVISLQKAPRPMF
jgi:hypothetical protein